MEKTQQYTKYQRRKYITTDQAWRERSSGSSEVYGDSERALYERIAEAQRTDNYHKEWY